MPNTRAAQFLLSAILLTGLPVLTGCAMAPKTTPHLVGVANFRDVGGYRTENGQMIRRGLLYRSAHLNTPTPEDRRQLAALGIRYEIDLRSEQERKDQPSRWDAPAPRVLTPFTYPGEGQANGTAGNGSSSQINVAAMTAKFMSPSASADDLNETMRKNYADMIVNNAPDMGVVLRDLSTEDAPALIHCTGGKDRTGQTVAILMTILEVPRDQVYQEYLKSNDSLQTWYEQTSAKLKAAHQPVISYDVFRARSGANRPWLEVAFASIDSHYGSFDQYVRDGLKLSPEDINRLKAKYLQN